MKVGITGHQKVPGIDWDWVRICILSELKSFPRPIEGLSSLAEGADQIFAEAILQSGGLLRSIIPTPDYDRFLAKREVDYIKS